MSSFTLDTELCKLLPPWYREILDYQQICQTETAQMEALADVIIAVADNFFFQTMDEGAVSQWEQILGIAANPDTESLEFRRARLINRISTRPPYTLGFLYQKLDELIGPGEWEVEVDYANYTLYIKSSAANQEYATEVAYTVNRIKPAHIVYVNQPYLSDGVTLDEQVELVRLTYRYRLGGWALGLYPFADAGYQYTLGSWVLGAGPFVSPDSREVIGMFGQRTVEAALLAATANFVSGDIASVRINGTAVIDALTKTVSGSTVTVEYTVTPETASTVTLIELLDSGGTVLTSSSVYVPISSPSVFTHTIPIKEENP